MIWCMMVVLALNEGGLRDGHVYVYHSPVSGEWLLICHSDGKEK